MKKKVIQIKEGGKTKEYSSITKAAKENFVTQQAISQAIKKLSYTAESYWQYKNQQQ